MNVRITKRIVTQNSDQMYYDLQERTFYDIERLVETERWLRLYKKDGTYHPFRFDEINDIKILDIYG